MPLNVRDVGTVLHVPAGMSGFSAVIAVVAGEPEFVLPFVVTGAGAAALGRILCRAGEIRRDLLVGETLASMALAWLLVPMIGAIPFLAAPLVAETPAVSVFSDPANAAFEAFSGFTSTGLSIVGQPSALPMSLQWWRSLSEWVGGIGFAILMLVAMNPNGDAVVLYRSELGKTFTDGVRMTARWIWWIYGGLTLAGICAFWALGMPAWAAINHGMTAVATGGFTVTDDSFRSYSTVLKWTAILFMTLGAISFAAYYEILNERRLTQVLQRAPVVALFAAIGIAVSVLWLESLQAERPKELVDLTFQAVSGLTTAGFNSDDLSGWRVGPLAVLIVCMIVGGASGSTSGGLKLDRVILLLRSVGWRLRRPFRPASAGRAYDVAGDSLSEVQARLRAESAAALAAVWLVTMLAGALALVAVVGETHTFAQVVFDTASALGGVGLSTGVVSSDLAATGKWTLIALMWLGRLEIFAGLSLLYLCVRSRGPGERRSQ